jgi:cysteine-rich repeat protein
VFIESRSLGLVQRLPNLPFASLFKDGASYIFEVYSVLDGHLYTDGALQRAPLGNGHREAITARLLLSSSCGNRTVDAAYEECDSGGVEDATCNADCTLPVCGDRITNAAAHEVCDDVADSLACDSDCTLVMCGDGHVNQVAGEGCDDGNTASGDGCSSSCTVEPGATCTGSPSVCTHI